MSQEARWLVEGLLEKNPLRRLGSQEPGLAALRTAPFFKGVDWALVKRRRMRSKLGLLFEQQAELRAEAVRESEGCMRFESEENPSCSAEGGIEGDCSESSLRLEDFTQECKTNPTLVAV